MAKIYNWPRHLFHGPRHHAGPIEPHYCMSCILGTHCLTCGGAESDLPTDCPGYRMDERESFCVRMGYADFIRKEGWVIYHRMAEGSVVEGEASNDRI